MRQALRAVCLCAVVLFAGGGGTGVAAQDRSAGFNLAAIADWSPQVPFLDLMKSARPWIGHEPGKWGGQDHPDFVAAGILDADGWPTRIPAELGSIGTLILTDMPEEAVSLTGRYRLSFEGDGIVEVSGRVRNLRYGAGQVEFDYTPGPGLVDIRIQRSEPRDYVREISVVKMEHVELFASGRLFNPVFLARLEGVPALRFMDWMGTNNSVEAHWGERPRVQDYSYMVAGVPAEMMIALANELSADAWFNMPHLGEDAYFRGFAEIVAAGLDPEHRAYVEFSNEVWNWQFDQTSWAAAQADARWGIGDKGMQYYGLRAAEMAKIWGDVFGEAAETQLVRVISSQTGWLGLEAEVLEAPLLTAEGGEAPAQSFDAFAVTGYFGGILGLEDNAAVVRAWIAESAEHAQEEADRLGLVGAAREAFVEEHRYDHANGVAGGQLSSGDILGDGRDTVADLLTRVLPYHQGVAGQYGLDLIVYEGGSHVVGIGPMVEDEDLTAFFTQFNFSPEMAGLYVQLLDGWQELDGGLFAAYSDVTIPSKWGSWGALRHLDDANPRWDVLRGGYGK